MDVRCYPSTDPISNMHHIQDDGSEDSDDGEVSAPPFAARYKQKFNLYTYTPISHFVYHLGPTVFTGGNQDSMALSDVGAARWRALTMSVVQEKLTLKIPGGK